ncbi:phosphotransferase family protein [Tenggerimyces flavus]|uniref:Phosphotransferase family protein n=1 Tax=Tenggerimyces flavus TaxID=1708749 RepID=A0ABV7YE90_9ACTN|nr:aminoglycoside phosphotransferase family protein [Tenggerimyces flavus]MBM7788178.1 aminoglycoside phosphotransferase (APT) family kinase protein [Tenggerimyces flavus]
MTAEGMSDSAEQLPPDEATLRWVRAAVGSGSLIASLRELPTASTALHAVDVLSASGVLHRLMLRRYHHVERLASDPWYLPSNEATVLGMLEQTDVPAPRLLAADTMATTCDLPTLLTTRLPGGPPDQATDPNRILVALADMLHVIHAIDLPVVKALPAYRPYYDRKIDGDRRPPTWSREPKVWERVFEVVASRPPHFDPGFIHRDYHPGQSLWTREHLVGIVDWTTGCLGPRGIDLARMRLNLAGRYGGEFADRFLALYQSGATVTDHHPYWDLLDAADGILDLREPSTSEQRVEYAQFEEWVARSVARL